jgi:hypothetical protein
MKLRLTHNAQRCLIAAGKPATSGDDPPGWGFNDGYI